VVLAPLLGVLAVALLAAPVEAARRTATFKLTSPAFANGAEIPIGFTCDGASASPPLVWTGVPKKAVQLALIVDDPDAPGGTFVHWVAWNIDPAAGRLPEQNVPATIVQGSNGARSQKYIGPCPPQGSPSHHYRFTLYALSKPPTTQAGATAAELRAAIRRTTLARTRLVGTYQRAGNAR
jgi:Raf kinase inhibitor-like YbhB/YbcL family protein